MGAITCDASEVVYIDAGLAGCCVAPDVKRAAVELTLYDIDSGKTRKRVLPGTIAPVEHRDSAAALARFPLAWSLVNKKLRILFPDIHSDSVGRIIFLLWTDLDVLSSFNKMPEEAPNGIQLPKGYARQNGVVTYDEMVVHGAHFQILSSGPFAVGLIPKRLNGASPEIIWYDLDNANIVVRMPLVGADDQTWMPCLSPKLFRWSEFQFEALRNVVLERESIRWVTSNGSQDIPTDSYSPVGSARITGRLVMSDDPKAEFPKDADWVIWEESDTDNRLCQMRGGRWSVCNDAPRKDAPKMIVVNNDANMVHLLYSKVIDPKDVEGSLKSIVEYLRSRGELSPGKNAGKGGNP